MTSRNQASPRGFALAIAHAVIVLMANTAWAGTSPQAPLVSTSIVISQVYGGAGCGTVGCSTYKNDFIELFNRGNSAVNVNGWSVQYASATGTSWQVTNLPNVSIPAGGEYVRRPANDLYLAAAAVHDH